MKKAICLLLALVLCFMLAACGSSGTGNEDYDYILSLLEKGEYDMAIQVIEMLRKNSSRGFGSALGQRPGSAGIGRCQYCSR